MTNELDNFIKELAHHEAYASGERYPEANLLYLKNVKISNFHFSSNGFTNLSRASFLNCTFENVDFSSVNLSLTRFNACSFKNVVFMSQIERAVFLKCNFQNSFFKYCKLFGVSFYKSDLSSLDLSYLKLSDSDFSRTRLNNTITRSDATYCFFINTELILDKGNKIFEQKDISFSLGSIARCENYYDSFYLPISLVHCGLELTHFFLCYLSPFFGSLIYSIEFSDIKGNDCDLVNDSILKSLSSGDNL